MTEQLFEYLRLHATPRGLVLVGQARLGEELHASHEALTASLTALEAEGKIEILTPFPFAVLALKPRPWSGSSSPRVQKEQQFSSNRVGVHKEVPVSSAAAAAMQQEDGGAGEGEALLDEVLTALGPAADREEFAQILTGQSAELVRRCLRRVEATKSIRVSRAALFRSLLQKLSK